jgi:hypothetical protein
MDDRSLYSRPQRRPLAAWAVALAIAFLLGAALCAVAVRRSDRLAAWLHPVAVPAPVRVMVPVPTPAPMPAAAPSNPGEEALAGRIADIEGRMDALDARAAQAAGDADRADGLLVAFAARRALDRGQALGYLEGLLRDRFGATDAPAVALVIAAAQSPVTLPQLQDGLADLAPTLTTAAGNAGWWAQAKAELGSLLVVRRADVASTQPVDRLARAGHALEQGQVEAAAAEVARLPGSARAAGWLALARRYSLARAALDRLETAALLKPRAAPPPAEAPGD